MSAKQKALFLSLLFILITLPIYADVLVLKNGKKLQGSIVKEDGQVYEFRDSEGILLTVKKSQIDTEATNKLNSQQQKTEAESSSQGDVESKATNKSVADIARAVRHKKSSATSKKVLTNEDVEHMPEVSIIGTERTEESIEDHGSEEHAPATDQYAEAEEYWKNETYKFKDELEQAREDAEALAKECDDLNKQAAYAIVDPKQYIIINGVLVPVSGGYYAPDVIQHAQEVCNHAEQAKKDVQNILKDLERFQERARREGALPGWIDPDRLP
jgi:hypothetical protein